MGVGTGRGMKGRNKGQMGGKMEGRNWGGLKEGMRELREEMNGGEAEESERSM